MSRLILLVLRCLGAFPLSAIAYFLLLVVSVAGSLKIPGRRLSDRAVAFAISVAMARFSGQGFVSPLKRGLVIVDRSGVQRRAFIRVRGLSTIFPVQKRTCVRKFNFAQNGEALQFVVGVLQRWRSFSGSPVEDNEPFWMSHTLGIRPALPPLIGPCFDRCSERV